MSIRSDTPGLLSLLNSIRETGWGAERPVLGEGHDHVPPECCWRFKEPDAATESAIAEAIRSFRGNVRWSTWQGGRNWVIVPQRIEEAMRASDVSLRELYETLSRDDPEFGRLANADIAALGQHILTSLRQRGLIKGE